MVPLVLAAMFFSLVTAAVGQRRGQPCHQADMTAFFILVLAMFPSHLAGRPAWPDFLGGSGPQRGGP